MDDQSEGPRRRAQRAHERAIQASDRADRAARRARSSVARVAAVDRVANRLRLENAGYALDVARSVWLHARIWRALDADIADQLTGGQLTAWLAEGVRRSR